MKGDTDYFSKYSPFFVKNALISPYGLVCTFRGIEKKSEYPMFPDWKNILTFLKKIALFKVIKYEQPCLVCLNPFWDNYYHWLAECMPRIFVNLELKAQISIVVPERAPDFVKAYLSLLDFKNIIWIKETQIIYSSKVHLSNSLPYNQFDADLILKMSNWMLKKLELQPKAIHKIFISRENAKYRKSEQEEALFKIYEKQGFVKYRIEDLDLYKQIELFAHAREIVGIHGAGFTNLIYAHNCQKITDYIHKDHNDLVFQNLSSILRIEFEFVYCDGVGKNSFKNNDDLKISI